MRKPPLSSFVGLICVVLAGCTASSAQLRTQAKIASDMEDSKLVYEKCLQDNDGAAKPCSKEHSVFEADLEAYSAIKKH
jgi:hypothetical protein